MGVDGQQPLFQRLHFIAGDVLSRKILPIEIVGLDHIVIHQHKLFIAQTHRRLGKDAAHAAAGDQQPRVRMRCWASGEMYPAFLNVNSA